MKPAIYEIVSADTGVEALLGEHPNMRFVPFGRGPQSPAYPYAVWQVISATPENYQDKTPDVDRIAVQVDCYSPDPNVVDQVAIAIRDAIEPHAHMTRFADGREPQTENYRVSMDFEFWTDR